MLAVGLGLVLLVLLVPSIRRPLSPNRIQRCEHHLRRIGVAFLAYHERYGSFPPAYTVDAEQQPLHSWRVLLLPFLDEEPLYRQFRLDEPWDSPHNLKLLPQRPDVFADTSGKSTCETCTAYAAPLGAATIFRGAVPVGRDEIEDPLSRTILIGEIRPNLIHWTEPLDVPYGNFTLGEAGVFVGQHRAGVYFLRADGSVGFMPNSTPAQWVKLATSRGSGELKIKAFGSKLFER